MAIFVKSPDNAQNMAKYIGSLLLFVFIFSLEGKYPELTPQDVVTKIHEIMALHATYKTMNDMIVKRALSNYLDELDPIKSYFIEPDILPWIDPSQETLNKVLKEYQTGEFTTFDEIFNEMVKAIQRRRKLEKEIPKELPEHVDPNQFKDLKWAKSDQELLQRLIAIKALQMEAASKLSPFLKEKSMQRIEKRQTKYEEELLTKDPKLKADLILTKILKATASALDSHTSYFTPDEATQFMINVQQRLFGIGAQLRDDINGFTILKIIEGGPAYKAKELKVKDRIIAVHGEPVVGMDIEDVVDMIRGEENTPVVLTVVREVGEKPKTKDITLDLSVPRGEVVLKESRLESFFEPFGNGVIVYLKLFSFYQDPEASSALDLEQKLNEIRKDHDVQGVILDLRSNSGGMLSQAVDVASLFVGKGVIVSIKDENGVVQHLRHVDSKVVWNGNLFVLVSRGSASASEIVAGTLKDYGRALIIGDDHTYGKGSYQTFTLNTAKGSKVNSKGEYKVTRGIYYTVSGHTPQLTGVLSNIVVPGPLSEVEVGEKYTNFPLKNDTISPSFEDRLDDIPSSQRERIRVLYQFDMQKKSNLYTPYLPRLIENSKLRIEQSKDYQAYFKELKKGSDEEHDEESPEKPSNFGDLQLEETFNIMRDLIYFEAFQTAKAA